MDQLFRSICHPSRICGARKWYRFRIQTCPTTAAAAAVMPVRANTFHASRNERTKRKMPAAEMARAAMSSNEAIATR